MAREERNIIGYTVGLISEFAKHYGIHTRQAYAYLKRFKGLEHFHEHYGVLHTQSFADDGVTYQLRRYEGGVISLARLVEELKYAKGITFQYFFGSEQALQQLKRLR